MTTAGVFSLVQGSSARSTLRSAFFPSYRTRRRGVPDDDRGSALCRAGFICEESSKQCFFFLSRIGIVGEECLMTTGECFV